MPRSDLSEWLAYEPGDLRRSLAVWLGLMSLVLMGVFG